MDGDLELDSDEELFRNPVHYEPAGINLDLDRADLGVPYGEALMAELLRMRKRVPVEQRGLICPDCRAARGRRVAMYLVERNGVWLASHYRKRGEKPISHESDEHLARKERVAADSEDHGFPATIESSAAEGHARLDVRIDGAGDIVLGYEPQLSNQTVRGMRAREGFRRRSGIRSVWDFANPDHAGIGIVPYVRTPDLPASVIRVQKNPIQIRDGNFVLEEGHCSPSGALDRCPEIAYDPENPTASGYCGSWHRVLVPAHLSSGFTRPDDRAALTLTQFIVEAAAGERVPFQRDGQHGWLPVQQWQKYVEANGQAPEEKKRAPSVREGARRDRCTEDRPASDVRSEPKERRGGRAIVLETRTKESVTPEVALDALGEPIPLCRFGCGGPASMPGPEGLPEHWSCRRKHDDAQAIAGEAA